MRYDALKENPVRDIAKMRKPLSPTMALNLEQVDAIREAVRGWRRGPGVPGPPPDGQLERVRLLWSEFHAACGMRFSA